jgi:paraquat-inducible protein B
VTTLETTTTAVRTIQADMSRTLASIDALAIESKGVVTAGGRDLRALLATTGRAAAKAEKLVTSIDDILAPRSPTRSNLDAALRDIAATASSLRMLTHDLERNPSGTIFGRSGR